MICLRLIIFVVVQFATLLHPQKLALTSPTGGGRSVGIVRVRTKATEFFTYYNKSPYLTTYIFVCTSIKMHRPALSGHMLLVDERLDRTRTSSPTTLDHWHCLFLGCKRRISLGKEIRFLNQSFTAGRWGLRSPPTSARSDAFKRLLSLWVVRTELKHFSNHTN